jgi:hypothetical protein
MKRIPFRWALPIFHLAMDAVLVVILVIAANSEREPQELILHNQPIMDTPPNPAYKLLVTSTLPADMIASQFIRGATDIGRRPIGWWWLSLFEALSIPFWFVIGWIADRGQRVVCGWVIVFAVTRIMAILLGAAPPWKVGAGLQMLLWFGATINLIGVGLWWLMAHVRPHLRSDA